MLIPLAHESKSYKFKPHYTTHIFIEHKYEYLLEPSRLHCIQINKMLRFV